MKIFHYCLTLSLVLPCGPLAAQEQKPQSFDRLSYYTDPKPLNPEARTSDWPRFLGPEDNGHSPENHLLDTFPSSGLKRIWEVKRGRSHTGPVIAGNRLVFIHEIDGKEIIECLHPENGRRFWKVEYTVPIQQNYGITDAPRSSPVIDIESGLVFTLGINSRLQAIELESGKIRWQNNLTDSLGKAPFFFGRGSCPLVYGDLLIVNAGAAGACVVAFNKSSGEIVWKAPHEWNASYASPIAARIHGKDRILVFAGGMTDPPHGGLLSIDPANGKIDSSFPWRSTMFASVNAASPVFSAPNQVFLTEGYDRGGIMISLDDSMKMSDQWQAPRFASQFQTPVEHEGHLYGFSGSSTPGAELVCYHAASGKEVWREGFNDLSLSYQGRDLRVQMGRASLLRVDDRFLCLGVLGTLMWMDLSPREAKILAKTQLFYSPETWAAPVISRGLLYITENGPEPKIICYDLRK